MTLADLWAEGGPVTPSDLAGALGVTGRYVRKAIAAGVLPAVRLPNLGASGRHDLGRFRIARSEARLFAESLGLKPEQSEQWEPSEQPEQRRVPSSAALR